VLLKLFDGSADEPDTKDPSKFYKLEFVHYSMNLALGQGKDPENLAKKPKYMTLAQLEAEHMKLDAQQIDATPLKIETHRRTAMAFSPLAFILIGLPLGITTRRAQRSIGLGLSVLVFLGYYLFLVLGQGLAQKGIVTPGLALWLGNISLACTGIVLLWRSSRR